MIVLKSWRDAPAEICGGAITIGNFDGVHLGHQRLLQSARELTGAGPSIAVTFDPPPTAVLRPEAAPRRLTTLDEKLRLFDELGMAVTLILHSDAALLAMQPVEFVDQVIVAALSPLWIVEGESFAFGRNRAGNAHTLAELGATRGFSVRVEPPRRVRLQGETDDTVVSSSMIRGLVAAGRVTDAATALGRRYSVVGRVEHGAGIGRELGFPTINLDIGEQQWPADGVYAGMAGVGEGRYLAAISVGTRPTVGGSGRKFEAFILDMKGDLYDHSVRVEFGIRLRDQRRFDGVDELRRQIGLDVAAVREWGSASL